MKEGYKDMVNKDYWKASEEVYRQALESKKKEIEQEVMEGEGKKEKIEAERLEKEKMYDKMLQEVMEGTNKKEEMGDEALKGEKKYDKMLQEVMEGKEEKERGMRAEEMRRMEEEVIRKKSDKVEIIYSSKFDAFLIRNVDLDNRCYKIDRKDLLPITSVELAKKMNVPEEKMRNIDRSTMLHLQLLFGYDEKYKTNKANQYLEEEQSEREAEEKARYMKEIFSINIHYDVVALYENENFSEEERQEILDIANVSKERGMASVKKGVKVQIRESVNKIKGLFSKIKTLCLAKGKGEEDRKKEQQVARTAQAEKKKAIGLIIEDRVADGRKIGNLRYLKQEELEKMSDRGLTRAEEQARKAKSLVEKDRGALQQYVMKGTADGKLEEKAKTVMQEKAQEQPEIYK